MNTIPLFILRRISFCLRAEYLNKGSNFSLVHNLIGHEQYVAAALELIQSGAAIDTKDLL